MKQRFIIGSVQPDLVTIKMVSTRLTFYDYLGAVMVRWGINRNNYKVAPGLYAVGSPDNSSDVFVTANYKLSFDHLRKNLDGVNGWILVLDTRGVNVWCAAGKGTFGTGELINRIRVVSLEKIVNHKRIILPQLGAVGVAAHKVKENTGFNIHYGPVRAADIKNFIDGGYRATAEMRRVTFNLKDRIKLIPVDMVNGKFYLLGTIALVSVLSAINKHGISPERILNEGIPAMLNILLAYLSGIVITPILLPCIPVRRFSVKGFITGILLSIILLLLNMAGNNYYEIVAWFLMIPAISSFLAMNFTGSSTFTSLSGVKKEMKLSVPLQITFSAAGLILFVIGKII